MERTTRQFERGLGIGVLTIAAMLLLAPAARAGSVFLPGELEDGRFTPAGSAGAGYAVRYATVTSTIDGDVARTEIRETIAAVGEPRKTVCLAPLPVGIDPDSLKVLIGPADGPYRPVEMVEFLTTADAQEMLETLAKDADSPGLMTFSGSPAMLARRVELGGVRELVIRFTHKIKSRRGIRNFTCPMPAAKWSAGPVGRVSVKIDLRTGNELPGALRAVFSPTHEAVIQRKDLHEARVRFKADNWSGEDTFRLCYVTDTDPLGLRVVAHRGEGDEDGYFMLVGNPTAGINEKAIDKDVVFVLDTSGSMRGEKIEQARAAIDYCLAKLNAGDRFNIITFGTDVARFGESLADNTPTNLAAARAFTEDVIARGRTNISGALTTALAGKATAGRPRMMIFLTDGTPTAGELSTERIVAGVKAANAAKTSIYVCGVGHDVNVHLLDKLAESTEGASEYVKPKEEIDVRVAALYDRLAYPVLTDVKVAFGQLRTHSVYPRTFPALFRGGQFMVFGRYRGGGKHIVKVSGTLLGKPTTYTCEATFPATADSHGQFVAPLWASRKIGYLLQELRLHGENKELIEDVVKLSTKFGIVTEYTEFIAARNGPVTGEAAVAETASRMRQANGEQTGQWAFNQAGNDTALQNRMQANNDNNFYRDRRGNLVANGRIRQIGRRVFYLNDGQWVDNGEIGKRKTRMVKLYSKDYFTLLRGNRDFARAQAVGWNVAMNIGDERIVVEKDGKTKIEEQRTPAPKPTRNQPDVQNNDLDGRDLNQFNRINRLQLPPNGQVRINNLDALQVQNNNGLVQRRDNDAPEDGGKAREDTK